MDKNQTPGKGIRQLFAQPPQRFYTGTAASLYGRQTMEIQGCRSVLEFEEGYLRLDMGGWEMEVSGNPLSIRAIEGKRLVVEGSLGEIRFSGGKKDD